MLSGNRREYYSKLLDKYKSGTCTEDEIRELFRFFGSKGSDELLEKDMRMEFDRIFNTGKKQAKTIWIQRPAMKILIAAASVSILVALWIFYRNGNQLPKNIATTKTELIKPGHTQAVLTLGNGSQIILDSSLKGQVAVATGTVISVNGAGDLVYDARHAENISINEITTPVGGIYKVVLPDGSNVWLNAASKLTFPSAFIGSRREVTLEGEGFFEITKDAAKPFTVKLNIDEEIKVLGTVFNVMVYGDEPHQKITLLEGSINFKQKGETHILKPGQQAVIAGDNTEIREALTEHETAWKNGLFDFQNDDLPSIMRKLSRWYNVGVELNARDLSGHYTGSIRKSSGIKEVLKMLEVAGNLNFSISQRKIIVNDK